MTFMNPRKIYTFNVHLDIHPFVKQKFLVKVTNSYHFFAISKKLVQKNDWRQQSKDRAVIPGYFKRHISFLFFLLYHVQHIGQSSCLSPHVYMWCNCCSSRHCILIPGRGREGNGRDVSIMLNKCGQKPLVTKDVKIIMISDIPNK